MPSGVSVSSTTVYEADITIPLEANTTYMIPVDLAVGTEAANSGINLALDVPSGAEGMWSIACGRIGATSMAMLAGGLGDALAFGSFGLILDLANSAAVCGLISITTTDAGNLVIKHRKTTGTGSVTAQAGSRATVYKNPTVQVLAEDYTNATNIVTPVQTINLAEGVHLLEVCHQQFSENAAVALLYSYSATNATFIALKSEGLSTAVSVSDVRTTGAETSATGLPLTPGVGCLKRILVTVAAGGGTFTIGARSENDGTQVTVPAGATIWDRLVTPVAASFPIANTSDTVPSIVFAFPVETKHYVATIGVALTTNSTNTGQFVGFSSTPGDGGIFACGYFSSGPTGGTTSGRRQVDDDIEGYAQSMGATECPAAYRMHIDGGSDEWTSTIDFGPGYDDTDTALVVADATGLSANTVVRCVETDELMFVTAVNTNTLTVIRGYNGTTAQNLPNGSTLQAAGGTPSFVIRREAVGSGDCTAERGFAILEEVQLAA
jgi:hypothetical protein